MSITVIETRTVSAISSLFLSIFGAPLAAGFILILAILLNIL